MRKTTDVEKLLGNTKFVIMMIISFVLIGINLSATEIHAEKRYSHEWEKNENSQNKKSTEKKYSKAIKKQNDLRKSLKDSLDNMEIYCKDLHSQNILTDDEWDNIKSNILAKADKIKQKDKFSF